MTIIVRSFLPSLLWYGYTRRVSVASYTNHFSQCTNKNFSITQENTNLSIIEGTYLNGIYELKWKIDVILYALT